MQTYHSNATTNASHRAFFQANKNRLSNAELAQQFNVSTQTIDKWKNRVTTKDLSSCRKIFAVAILNGKKIWSFASAINPRVKGRYLRSIGDIQFRLPHQTKHGLQYSCEQQYQPSNTKKQSLIKNV